MLDTSATRAIALALVTAAAPHAAHAQEPREATGEGGRANCAAASPCCESDEVEESDACWDLSFLSLGRGSVLGLQVLASRISTRQGDATDSAVLASYRAEALPSQRGLTGRMAVRGAIGGGTAGTEGALALDLSVGPRFALSPRDSLVLRAGPRGSLRANDRAQLSLLEPLRLSAGVQRAREGQVMEVGIGSGLVALGRFATDSPGTNLGGALEVGTHVTAQLPDLRLGAEAGLLLATPWNHGGQARLEAHGCRLQESIAMCAELELVQSRPHAYDQSENNFAVYISVTLGLTP